MKIRERESPPGFLLQLSYSRRRTADTAYGFYGSLTVGSQSRWQDCVPQGIRRMPTSNMSDVIFSSFETLSIMGFGMSKSYTSPIERL